MKTYRTKWHSIALLIFFAAVFLIFSPQARGAEQTGFKITIVAASNSGSGTDTQLKTLRAQLSQHRQYKRFRFISTKTFTIAIKESRSFTIVKSIKATIMLKWMKNNRAAFKFSMTSKSKNVNIDYSMSRPGTTMIIGPRVGGETYIVVIQTTK